MGPDVAVPQRIHDAGGHTVEFYVAGAGGCLEEFEGLGLAAAVLGHDDPDRDVDGCPGFERGLEVCCRFTVVRKAYCEPEGHGRLADKVLRELQHFSLEPSRPVRVEVERCPGVSFQPERNREDGTDTLLQDRLEIMRPTLVRLQVLNMYCQLLPGGGHARTVSIRVLDLVHGLGLLTAAGNSCGFAVAEKGNAAQNLVAFYRQAAGGYACKLVKKIPYI